MDRRDMIWAVRDQSQARNFEVSDRLIDSYLDDGFNEVMSRRSWPFNVSVEEFETFPNQIRYPLSNEAQSVMSVLDVTHGSYLRSESLERILAYENQGPVAAVPLMFAIEDSIAGLSSGGYVDIYDDIYVDVINVEPPGTMLHLYPWPVVAGDQFRVWYKVVDRFGSEDDAVPPWTGMFHEILVDWAIYRLYERMGDLASSDRFRGRFEDRMGRMSGYYNRRTEDRPAVFGSGYVRNPPSDQSLGFVLYVP